MGFGSDSRASQSTEGSISFHAPASLTGEKDMANLNTPEMVLSALKEAGAMLKDVLQDICSNSDFARKYDLTSPKLGEPYIYALTTLASPYRYSLEAFPKISKPSPEELLKGPEEFKFHNVFETAIERFTETNAKPNAVLRETRSNDFCYPLTINIEAVPIEKAKKPIRLLLLREFQILVGIWEKYKSELKLKKCNIDQLVGFPMPFEFCLVSGTEFDVPEKSFVNYSYYGIDGTPLDFKLPFKLPLSSSTSMCSTLSYMSVEKLGPSVSYLVDMLKTQAKIFSLSSALKVYDQLICRLLVMHKYGVVHGDLNTDCLRFGSGNACNVLYISDFSTSVMLPSKGMPAFLFHDRFVSSLRVKDKVYHFVHDLESAYYIFILLAVGCLPWDNKIKRDKRDSLPNLTRQMNKDGNTMSMTDQSSTTRDKENFWETPSIVQRLVNSREFELDGGLYHNFTEDLMVTIHMKMKDIIVNCSRVGQEAFLRDIGIFGTAASNAYLSLRKTIASYFRYETLSAFLKDPATQVKINLLRTHDPEDNRVAWNLSSWCWNHIGVDTKPSGLTAYLHKTLLMQTSD